MMFEPNNQPTWEKVRAAIYNYVFKLWQQGALLGNKPEEEYICISCFGSFVKYS